jgi:DNA polymerase III subunit beta
MNTTETMTVNEITHDHLAAAVAAAVKFCPGARCPKPVLQTVLVRCDDDGTTATATDLEHRIIVRLPGGSGRGVALVPATAAKAMAKAGGGVRFSGETVSAAGVTAPMDDPMEYPCHPLCELPPSAVLRFDHVEMIAKAVAPATDNESSRFALGGIQLETEAGRVLAIGTDGRRLHLVKSPSIMPVGEPLNVIAFPVVFSGLVKAVRSIGRDVLGLRGKRLEDALASSAVEIRRSVCDRMIELRWTGAGVIVAVQGREIEGRFPRWRDVFPEGCFHNGGTITLRVADALDQMKAAKRVEPEMAKGVTFADGQVSAGHKSSGTFAAPVAGEMNCPAIKLDPSFVADALAAADTVAGCPMALFRVSDDRSPVFIHANGGHGGDAILHIVIMPLAAD